MLPIVQNVPLPPGNLFGAAISSGSEDVNARDLPITIVPKPADVIKGENDLRGTPQAFDNRAILRESSLRESKKKSDNIVNRAIHNLPVNLDYLEGVSEVDKKSFATPIEKNQKENVEIEQNIPKIMFQQVTKIFESIIQLSVPQVNSRSDRNALKDTENNSQTNNSDIRSFGIEPYDEQKPISIIV